MTTEEIIQGNKMIAEFMGIKTKIYSDTPTVIRWQYGNSMLFESDLKYHSSWDWLMPVVEKIESTWIDGSQSSIKIHRNYVEIVHEVGYHNVDYAKNSDLKKNNQLGGECYPNNYTKLENTYRMVIDFIQWYNDNLKNQQP